MYLTHTVYDIFCGGIVYTASHHLLHIFQSQSPNIDHNGIHFHGVVILFVVSGEDRIHILCRSGRKRHLNMAQQVSDYSVVMQTMVRKNIFFLVYNYLEN